MDAIAPDVEPASTETGMAHGGRPQLHVLPSAKRTLLFAMLAWAPTYTGIIEAEHAMHEVLLDQMQADWASSYMRWPYRLRGYPSRTAQNGRILIG